MGRLRTICRLAVLLFALTLAGCSGDDRTSRCGGCHRGIETVSLSHHGCSSCHGGDERATAAARGHLGMFGPRNPAEPDDWEKSCGRCHWSQLQRVRSSLMFTNAGMIRNIRLTWEGGEEGLYGVQGGDHFDGAGTPVRLGDVADLDNLSGELYRKFCSQCHVGTEVGGSFAANHGAGCGACHFPFDDTATSRSRDPLVAGRSPSASSHRLEPLPGTGVCGRCHNRSGRIALSYTGLLDGNNALVPTRNGRPGPQLTSDGRNLVHIAPDIHAARGMECIDCHTSRDVMGDGYTYANLYHQVEISCADCHGGARPPRWRELTREHEDPIRESAGYRFRMQPGTKMVLTAKGRPYSNVYFRDGVVYLLGKRSGRLHRSPVITGTPAHTVTGHERLACHACHSRTVIQCFGCHTRYDRSQPGLDLVRRELTPGRFSETEDYRALYPFPLALDQQGRVAPVTPGCQTFVTEVDEAGTTVRREAVARFRGEKRLRFAPFYSHNTGSRAVGCAECHANPAFLGFGQQVTAGNSLDPTLRCELDEGKPLDGFLTLADGKVRPHAAIVREGARPLDATEVRRTLAVNLCLICHDRPDDPIYRRRLDYNALADPLHRRLLSPAGR